jgi:VanZ family protein
MNRWSGMPFVFLYVIYIAIAVFYPFEFSLDSGYSVDEFIKGFSTIIPITVERLVNKDFVINFLVFVPYGFLLYYSLTLLGKTSGNAILLASLCGAVLSFLIELLQVFLPDRYPSATDVLANTLGTFGGTLFYALGLSRFNDLSNRFLAWPKLPLFAILYGALPLIFTCTQYPWTTFRNWNPSYTFQIGSEATSTLPFPPYSWLGKMFFVALYSRALTPAEIVKHFALGYSSGAGRPTTRDPIALYTFSEGKGSIVHDRSGFRQPLELVFFPESSVRWLQSSNGIEIVQPAILRPQRRPTKLFDAFRDTNELSIEVWIAPGGVTQKEFARIVCFSPHGSLDTNFTLGQLRADINFRVRTPISGQRGSPAGLRTRDRFLDSELFHIVATYKDGVERLYVDGIEHSDRLNLTRDVIIGFGVKKTSVAQIAYISFYFFPVSLFLAAFFSRRVRGFVSTFLAPVGVGTGLLATTEIFQSFALNRAIDVPLMGYGVIIATIGSLIGVGFLKTGSR